jgi:ankyrin repeat protein
MGRRDICEYLLDQGSPIDETSKNGETALSRACYYNRHECVNFLLQRGANTEVRDLLGATPLIIAVFRKKPKIVNQLLESGAEIKTESKNPELRRETDKTILENEEIAQLFEFHRRKRVLLPLLNAFSKRSSNSVWDKSFDKVNKNVMQTVLQEYL